MRAQRPDPTVTITSPVACTSEPDRIRTAQDFTVSAPGGLTGRLAVEAVGTHQLPDRYSVTGSVRYRGNDYGIRGWLDTYEVYQTGNVKARSPIRPEHFTTTGSDAVDSYGWAACRIIAGWLNEGRSGTLNDLWQAAQEQGYMNTLAALGRAVIAAEAAATEAQDAYAAHVDKPRTR